MGQKCGLENSCGGNWYNFIEKEFSVIIPYYAFLAINTMLSNIIKLPTSPRMLPIFRPGLGPRPAMPHWAAFDGKSVLVTEDFTVQNYHLISYI